MQKGSRHILGALQVRAELTNRIEELNRGRSNTTAWVKALRHDLALERVKREMADERLAIVTDATKVVQQDYDLFPHSTCKRQITSSFASRQP